MEYKTLKEFYPYYRTEHQKTGTRVLHFIGTSAFLVLLSYAVVTQHLVVVPCAVVSAYGFAWIGHFFIEHNKPATFKYPVFSLLSDFIMYYNILTGKEGLVESKRKD